MLFLYGRQRQARLSHREELHGEDLVLVIDQLEDTLPVFLVAGTFQRPFVETLPEVAQPGITLVGQSAERLYGQVETTVRRDPEGICAHCESRSASSS